ncbi:acetyl-CoA carboxylase biotin carboxyl carrier protein [Oceanobacillus jeddahense]|uniref:acetyl-CoA carboxylase biotin carboxyl carrier protein n=1 Tax=Oceanobacillus jeddahense TaxID=1462527 RepID=UPI000595ECCF|nr:acetyl-CoA carboxylase biotin carboxyl carrier protein [Oceanobacillus jeddahense]
MLKVEEINSLIKLIDQTSISEFTYEANGTVLSMKKNNEMISADQQGTGGIISEQLSEKEIIEKNTSAISEKISAVTETEETIDDNYEIVSPIVGTLYMSPSPDSEPYVSEGAMVKKDTVVCIVEAMKLFNEVEAEIAGEIVEILAEDGEMVEYGQPLFRVREK